MRKAFTDIFIKHPVLAIVVNLVIVLMGWRALTTLPVQQYPKIESSSVVITTVYFGAGAETVRAVRARLPAVWLGIPDRDIAMWRENLAGTVELTGPKLFMVKADLENPDGNDQESLDVLKELYPNGQLRMFDSDVPGHDFWIFLVPDQ